ncbi:hypothetical protein SteCoe_9648 [Stentor coeruleus]|uniref:Uncharacterized protein n=1 Tax=Stentor coeruleus TaxID=5963 RepID=A0A1R2CHK0_9CILI|nr:hypothetical protein SteCoe_9648 [Stentor coeruleus]
MESKGFYKVLDHVYKTLRISNDKDFPQVSDQYTCKVKFSHKPFIDEFAAKASQLEKNRLFSLNKNLKSCCTLSLSKLQKAPIKKKPIINKNTTKSKSVRVIQNKFNKEEKKISLKCETLLKELKISLTGKTPKKIDLGVLAEDLPPPETKSSLTTNRNKKKRIVIKSFDFHATPTFVRDAFSKKK